MATSNRGFFLNQRKYILDLLTYANMTNSKHASTPLDNKLKLNSHAEALKCPTYYQKLMGKLIYLTIIRPDTSFAEPCQSTYTCSNSLSFEYGETYLATFEENNWLRNSYDQEWAH